MARQVRAEVTRDSVLRGAAEVFTRLGYANAGLGEIIQESGVTKGALYFHFASKEDLARGVIDTGVARLGVAAQAVINDRTPALETMIELSVVPVDRAAGDIVVQAMLRLIVEVGDYRGTHGNVFEMWLEPLQDLARRARDEGDLVADLDPDEVAMLVLEMFAGARTVAAGLDRSKQSLDHLESLWRLLLPALVPASKVGYFHQFAARRLRTS